MSRVPGQLASTVLRGPRRSNAPGLPDRALRRPVVTRKNAYGSRTEDAARLAARVWTVTATVEMAGLNPITYLTAYLDACGRTGGKPPGLARTWNALPALGRDPRRPQHLGTATPPRLTPRRPRHGVTAAKWSRRAPTCPPQDFRIFTLPEAFAEPLHSGSPGWYLTPIGREDRLRRDVRDDPTPQQRDTKCDTSCGRAVRAESC